MSRPRARELRRNLTDTGRFVWTRLRNRRFAAFKLRRQVPIGPYIADFACFDRRLILELDGGQHAERQEYDARRTAELERRGFCVMRFWNNDVLKEWDSVEEAIWLVLTGTAFTPTVPPLLPSSLVGEGSRARGDGGFGPARSAPLTPNPSPTRGEGDQKPAVGTDRAAER